MFGPDYFHEVTMEFMGQQAKCPKCSCEEIDRVDQGAIPSSAYVMVEVVVRPALERFRNATCRACRAEWLEVITE